MAGGAKMAALAGESQQILVITIFTLNTGKTKMQITALQVFVDDLAYKRTPVAKSGLVALLLPPAGTGATKNSK